MLWLSGQRRAGKQFISCIQTCSQCYQGVATNRAPKREIQFALPITKLTKTNAALKLPNAARRRKEENWKLPAKADAKVSADAHVEADALVS